jgi:penicillin-binding protein 1A
MRIKKENIIKLLTLLKEKFTSWRKKRKARYKAASAPKKVLIMSGRLIFYFFLYLFLVDINFLWLFGKSPGLLSINNPEQSVASEIYSADGKLIGKYFRENRTPVKYNEIAPIMVKALIATEDERYYEHMGIDFQGLVSAAKDMMHGKARGASTISQQLVKNMFKTRSQYSKGLFGYIPGAKLIIMKTKEWITAFKIELFYSKQEILTMYLNTVDFGSNAYGIKTACKTYFSNNPKDLSVDQAAILVGLLKATTTYNPRINPKNSIKRRNIVLDNLASHNIISQHQCDSLKRLPIKLQYKVEQNYDGNALYFREAVVDYLKDWCKENNIDLFSDGLKIYTSIDSRMQQYAEDAVQKQMRIVQNNFNNHWGREEPWRDENQQIIPHFIEDLAKRTGQYKALTEKYPNNPDYVWSELNKKHKLRLFDYKKGYRDTTISTMDSIRYMERYMHSGFVAIEPQTGYVKAWVGDIDFNFWKYDKVTSERQPGSTFKLFVYSTAFNQGMSPCDRRRDEYIAWDYMEKGEQKHWVPRNANGNYSGDSVTLKCAFGRSLNSIAVKISKEVGYENIINTAYKMGVKTKLNHIPSVCLGSSDMTLLELVNSYCTVINEGIVQNPILVTKIVDKDGKVIYESKQEPKQAIPYETSFLMTEMLKAGLTEPMATSQALWAYDLFHYNTEFGGKTGTSSNHSDAWFVGVSPKLVGGAWVGGEHRCIHFRTGKLGEGSKTALPIFGYFMEKVLKDPGLKKYQGKFPKPKQDIERNYRCQTPYPVIVDDSVDRVNDSILVGSESNN